MVSQKNTELDENTAPVSTDLVYMVTDPGGTPVSEKATYANATKALAQATETAQGVAELATQAEAEAGTSDTTIMTPLGVQQKIDGSGLGGIEAQIVVMNATPDPVAVTMSGDVTIVAGGATTVVAADLTTAGKIEIATVAETNTGTDATRAVSPDGLDGWTGSAQVTAVGTLASGNADAAVSAADLTTPGKIEVATAAETTTGTDAGRAVSPDGLAGSDFGKKTVQATVTDFTTDTATGNGQWYFHVPTDLNGMNLVAVHAEVITAGTTGTTDIQIANVTQVADMLSTKLTIDSAETGSDTAATPAVIDTANDDVATNDLLRIDVDAVSTTAAKGLLVTLTFQLP